MYISKRSGVDHTVLPANTPCLLAKNGNNVEATGNKVASTTVTVQHPGMTAGTDSVSVGGFGAGKLTANQPERCRQAGCSRVGERRPKIVKYRR